ncbi:O-acetyl-ADP-ribose deacetylase [Marinilactibacillus kalidii]|uniref:O-acetyl-ADP-ribose deacetylase n=1 Tax=Marinilactibacillus kalidii TaxID=2820274 RepID=UPI0031344F09
MQVKTWRGDITTLSVDAVVNAANKSLLGGGGVDGAIHRAAGSKLLEATRALHGAKTGEAKMTKGFQLPADYVIHTVGPVYKDGQQNEDILLADCYANALKVAKENKLKSIAFPAISTGIYGYPSKEAAKIAIDTINHSLKVPGSIEEVVLVAYDEDTENLYKQLLADNKE